MNQITILLVTLFASTHAFEAIPAIGGFHFHVYYFQNNLLQKSMAEKFHSLVQSEIKFNGHLANCALGRLRDFPVGPHPIAQFTTCCNATALPNAVGFFMKTRDKLKLPILLHPLTVNEKMDHSHRAMWMGPKVPLDSDALSDDLHSALDCNHF